MPINNLDNMISGFCNPLPFFYDINATEMEAANIWANMNYMRGNPGPMIAPTPGISGVAVTTYSGGLLFRQPVAPLKAYLGKASISSYMPGGYMLVDRLWHNSGITPTTITAQTINSVDWPARCLNATGGNSPNISGFNIMVGLEVSTNTTNVSAITNTTIKYTNSNGVSDRTAIIASFPATAVKGTFVPFLLASGDVGVKSIQTLTLGTSYGTGVIHLVAFRPILIGGTQQTGMGVDMTFLQHALPELYENSVLNLLYAQYTTLASTYVYGNLNIIYV